MTLLDAIGRLAYRNRLGPGGRGLDRAIQRDVVVGDVDVDVAVVEHGVPVGHELRVDLRLDPAVVNGAAGLLRAARGLVAGLLESVFRLVGGLGDRLAGLGGVRRRVLRLVDRAAIVHGRSNAQLIGDALDAVVVLRRLDGAGARRFARHGALQGDHAILHIHIDVAAAEDVLIDELRVNLRDQPAILDGS